MRRFIHIVNLIVNSFKKVFGEIIGAYEKIRFQAKGFSESQFVYGKEAEEPLLIIENGVRYATYLNEGLMTGIFFGSERGSQ